MPTTHSTAAIRRLLATPHARLGAFLAFALAAYPISGVVTGFAGASGSAATLVFSACLAVTLAAATLLCTFLTGERLGDLGFTVQRRQLPVVLVAFVVSASALGGVALVRGRVAGGTWLPNATAPLGAALAGLLPVLCLFLGEELLFRGYAFQQLRRIVGATGAVLLTSALFGGYHLLGSGDWAMGAVYRMLMPTLGGVVFAYALIRTGSLAVPVALHCGGNWMQSVVLGLGHGPSTSSALWVMPLTPEQARLVTAPDLFQHAPYLIALGLTLGFVRRIPSRHGLTTR